MGQIKLKIRKLQLREGSLAQGPCSVLSSEAQGAFASLRSPAPSLLLPCLLGSQLLLNCPRGHELWMRLVGSSDKPNLDSMPRTPSVPPSPGGLAHPLLLGGLGSSSKISSRRFLVFCRWGD